MSRRMRIAIFVSVMVVVAAVLMSQIVSFQANHLAQHVIKTKDAELKSKDQQIDATRKSRDVWADTAKATNEQKVQIDCAQFDRVNAFVTVVARLFDQSNQLTPQEKALLMPFLTPQKRPAACPQPERKHNAPG